MATPRAVKDSDTALWLHNKLGSAEELWVSSSIGGIIKTDTIDNIYRCFSVLTTTVKMKLLLGILHLPRRNLDEMKHTIEGLVELALEDVDQWVRLVANVVKTYPMRGKLNLDLSSNSTAASVIEQLREKVNDSDVFSTLPLECQYVNKNALQSLVGSQPPPVRHFALKRKPKSAALRVDLMQRSNDASNQFKKDGSGFNKTVPVKHRDMTRKFSDASPMRGIPKTPSSGHRSEGFRSQTTPGPHLTPAAASRTNSRFGSRSERGTKLLDISEQPVGIREQKRRKKQQQEEETSQQTPAEEKQDETPEYAVGLPQNIAQPVISENEPSGPSEDNATTSKNQENEEDDEEPEDVEMEDQDYTSRYNSPPDSPTKHLSSIDQEEPQPANTSQPEVSLRRSATTEKRPSVEELPVYAMPATPSPYFKPVATPGMVVPSPVRPMIVPSSPKTPSSNTSSTSASSSSPSPARNQLNPTISPVHPSSVIRPNVAVGLQQKVNVVPISPQLGQTNIQNRTVRAAVPQVQRFYTEQIQNPSVQVTQASAVPQQSNIQRSATIVNTQQTGLYQPQVPIGLRPARVPYMVSPNIVQLQQLRSPNIRFSPAPNIIAGQAGVLSAHSQVYGQQIRLQAQLQQQAAQQAAAAQAAAAQQAASAQTQQQVQPQKKALTLTKEQMYQAQEMFKTANKLSRQEKAIILGFMAGSRDNPTPDKGDIISITLSEHDQMMQNPTGGAPVPVVVETFFEMNYRTGATAKKQRLKQYVTQYKT